MLHLRIADRDQCIVSWLDPGPVADEGGTEDGKRYNGHVPCMDNGTEWRRLTLCGARPQVAATFVGKK